MIFYSHRSLASRNARIITLHRTRTGMIKGRIGKAHKHDNEMWKMMCGDANAGLVMVMVLVKRTHFLSSDHWNVFAMHTANQPKLNRIEAKSKPIFRGEQNWFSFPHAFKWSANQCCASLALAFLLVSGFWVYSEIR